MNAENRWTIGGIVLLILFAVGCYFWYRWETEPYRQAYEQTQQLVQEWTASQQTDTQDVRQASAENEILTTAEKPLTEATAEVEHNTDAPIQQHAQTPQKNTTTVDMRVSPHGFGPYPKIPDEWIQGFFDRELSREHELLGRVRIKLHEQGVPTLGVGIDKTGMVYPFAKDQVYITFNETYLRSLGHVRYIADIYGDATVLQQIESNAKARNSGVPIPVQIQIEADIPAGVQVLNKSEGFDPYEFLNLKRQ